MQEGDELAQILDGAADTVHRVGEDLVDASPPEISAILKKVHRVDEDLVDASFLDHLPHALSLGALEEGDHPGHLLLR